MTHSQKNPYQTILKRILISFGILLAIGLLIFAVLFYRFFVADDEASLSSTSPSGQLTFTTSEGCIDGSCWHDAEIITNTGFFNRESNKCDLDITDDRLYFTSGSRIRWNTDETVVTWYAAHGETGEVNLKQQCSQHLNDFSPSSKRILSIAEFCLSKPCQRTISLGTYREDNSSIIDFHDCQLDITYTDRLFTAASPIFTWNAKETQITWQTDSPKLSGVIDLKTQCGSKN